jgi:hypothetical protein
MIPLRTVFLFLRLGTPILAKLLLQNAGPATWPILYNPHTVHTLLPRSFALKKLVSLLRGRRSLSFECSGSVKHAQML